LNRLTRWKKSLRSTSQKLYHASQDILKWSILAVLVGVSVGFGVAAALKALELAIDYFHFWHQEAYYYLPLVLAISGYSLWRFFPQGLADGTEEIVRATIYKDKSFNFWKMALKQITIFFTLLFQGSAGKEAPAAQMGAYFSSLLSPLFRIDEKERIILIITGTSAGFAVVLGSPIAAGFFALEALFAGKILYRVLVPAFISSFIAYWSMQLLDVEYIYHPVSVGLVPSFWELVNIIKVVIAGLVFGFVAYGVILAMHTADRLAKSAWLHPLLKGLLGGTVLIAVAEYFGQIYLGLGLEVIDLSFEDIELAWYTPLLKIFTTFMTLGFGGSGGFVTPIFFIGATTGNVMAHLLDANVSLFAALGFVSLLSGATNAPIAATILAAELFGIEVAHFAAVTSIISYLISSQKSVFSPEILETIERKFNRHLG